MNIKFEQSLVALGITVSDVSHSLRDKINEFYNVKEKYDSSKEDLKLYEGEELEELSDTVASVGNMLNDMDEELVIKITKWHSKKDQYAASAAKLQASRDQKKNGNGGAIANANIPVSPDPKNPVVVASSGGVPYIPKAAASKTIPATGANTVINEPVKEKSSWGWLETLGLVVVGVITLGIVSANSKK
jgi:hypothetical protein